MMFNLVYVSHLIVSLCGDYFIVSHQLFPMKNAVLKLHRAENFL